jgi:cytoskeletal protein CcmA (bactofilin family)
LRFTRKCSLPAGQLRSRLIVRHDRAGREFESNRTFCMSALPKRALIRTESRRSDGAIPASRLGRGLTITGSVDTEGELHIHGRVRGSIRADRLVIAPGSDVEGDIIARDAQISGRVLGRVFAVNVSLDSSSEVTGRIFHHTVEVARGARIDARMPWRPLNFFETLEQLPETQP